MHPPKTNLGCTAFAGKYRETKVGGKTCEPPQLPELIVENRRSKHLETREGWTSREFAWKRGTGGHPGLPLEFTLNRSLFSGRFWLGPGPGIRQLQRIGQLFQHSSPQQVTVKLNTFLIIPVDFDRNIEFLAGFMAPTQQVIDPVIPAVVARCCT